MECFKKYQILFVFCVVFSVSFAIPQTAQAQSAKCLPTVTKICTADNPDGSITECGLVQVTGQENCFTTYPDGRKRVATSDEISNTQVEFNSEGDVTGVEIQNNALGALGTLVNWLAALTFEGLAWVGVQLTFLFIQLLTFVLYITASLLDFIVTELILGMGKYVATGTASGIYIAWTVMRDLANIGIIGGLVAAAFGTILNLSKINAKTLLARLIIAALLVNFSYFFAAAMIDVSNFTAGIIYKTTISKNCTDLGGCTITNRFMQVSNFQALAGNSFLENSKTPEALGGAALAGAGYAAVGPVGAVAVIATADFLNKFGANTINLVFNLMFIVFLCVTIYVFLSAISLLLGRFVALVLLIVASPLGIAGLAVPGLQKYAQEWWSALASQALFAPIYFLLVGISLMILDGFVKSAAQAGKSAVQNAGFFTPIGSSGPELLGVFVSFLIAITFMLLSLRAAKEMSKSKYLEGIYKTTGAVTGAIGKFGGALAYRNTLGRFGDYAGIRYKEWISDKQDKWWYKGVMKPFGVDLAMQAGLGGLKDKKIFGYDSRGTVKQAHIDRETALNEEQKKQQQLKSLRGKMSTKDWGKLNNLFRIAQQRSLTPEESAEFEKLTGALTPEENQKLKDLQKKSEDATEGKLDATGKKIEFTKEDEEEVKKLEERSRRAGALGNMLRADARKQHEVRLGEKLETSDHEEHAELLAQKAQHDRLNALRASAAAGTLKPGEEEELKKLEAANSWTTQDADKFAEYEKILATPGGKLDDKKRKETDAEFWLRQAKRGNGNSLSLNKSAQYEILSAGEAAGTLSPTQAAQLKALRDTLATSSPLTKDEWERHEILTAKKIAGTLTVATDINDLDNLNKKIGISQLNGVEWAEMKTLHAAPAGSLTPTQKARLEDLNKKASKAMMETAEEKTARYAAQNGERGLKQNRDESGHLIEEGVESMEGAESYQERIDKMRIGDRFNHYRLHENDGPARELRTGVENIFSALPQDFIKEEYYKDQKSIIPLATALPEKLWNELANDKTISRKIRNQMWVDRRGVWARQIKEIMDDVHAKRLVIGSDTWSRRTLVPYNYSQRYIKSGEFNDAIRSNAVFDEASGMRLEQLRDKKYLPGLMAGSTSSLFIGVKDQGILGTTAWRDFSAAKRKTGGVDVLRDQHHTVAESFGFVGGVSGDQGYVKHIEGEVDLHAGERDDILTKGYEKDMPDVLIKAGISPLRIDAEGQIIRNPDGTLPPIDDTEVSVEDVLKAEDNLRFGRLAQKLKNDQRYNPRLKEIEQKINDIRAVEYATMEANEEGLTAAEMEKEVRALGRAMVMQETENQYIAELKNINKIASRKLRNERLREFLKDNAMYLIHKKIEAEEGTKEWFAHKNPDEVAAILNKRSWHSTATAYGVKVAQLEAIVKQDGAEQSAFWENFLARGDDSLLANYATNDTLKAKLPWPSEKTMHKINRIRRGQGRKILPVTLVEEELKNIAVKETPSS